jgi:hypothetical protein
MKEKEIRLECLKLAEGDMIKARQFLKFVHDDNTPVMYTLSSNYDNIKHATFPDTTKAWKPAHKDYKLSVMSEQEETDKFKNQDPKIQEYWENSV